MSGSAILATGVPAATGDLQPLLAVPFIITKGLVDRSESWENQSWPMPLRRTALADNNRHSSR